MNMKPIRYIKENFGKIPFCNEKPDTAPHLGKILFSCLLALFCINYQYSYNVSGSTCLVEHDISTVDIICYDMPDRY